ncbi:MAG: hypothetical protein EOS17_13975 [Mesorhizobium sp.]|nr:MAG: hypothetical protein EOS17_13975 [Mesorhizobium sp.]
MTKAHLTQLWQWLSVVCVLFLVASVVSIQGGSEFLGSLFGDKVGVDDNMPATGYFGAIVGGGLFVLSSSVFLLHARRHGDHWHARIPVVWLDGLDTATREGKIFQICVLVIFVLVPVAGVMCCMAEAESGDICEQDTRYFYEGSETMLLWAPVAKEGNQMRLRQAGTGAEPCLSGVELFPRSLTPLTFYGLPLAAGVITTMALISLFSRRKTGQSDGFPEVT